MSGLTIPTIIALRRRDGRSARRHGLSPALRSLRTFGLGVVATATPAALLLATGKLALRGYAYSTFRVALRRWVAALLTTTAFLLVPGASNAVHAGLRWLVFGHATSPAFVPEGEDPITYLVLLAVFGVALVVARAATRSVWTAVGRHLTFLLLNRVTFFGDSAVTGSGVELPSPMRSCWCPPT